MACEDDRLPGYTFVWRAATWGTSSSTRTRILFIFSWVHRSMSESESPAIALLKLAPSGSILAWNQPFICQRGPQFGLSVVQTSAPETPPRISSNQVFMTDSMRSSLRSVSAGLSRCSLWPVAVAASTGESLARAFAGTKLFSISEFAHFVCKSDFLPCRHEIGWLNILTSTHRSDTRPKSSRARLG